MRGGRSRHLIIVSVCVGGAALSATFPRNARADEPAPATPDLEAEIAWARATWPDAFADVHFRRPVADLLAWAPPHGLRTVYLYTPEAACRDVALESGEPEKLDDGSVEPPTTLWARLRGTSWIDKGKVGRNVKLVAVGDELAYETGAFPTEVKDAHGRWKLVNGPALGLAPERYGWLSYVDDRVARWDAQPAVLDIRCEGAVEWLRCAAGGERSCQRCDQVVVHVDEVGMDAILGARVRPSGLNAPELGRERVATCHDPCPVRPDSPEVVRLRALGRRVELWRDSGHRKAEIPSLYKSRTDCLRDHPSRRRGRSSEEE